MGGSISLEEMMEYARRHALLDEWTIVGGEVRLTIGTYEIELGRSAAVHFVRVLLKNYEAALTLAGE